MTVINLSHDDDAMTVIDKVNAALAQHNLQLEDDGQGQCGEPRYTLNEKYVSRADDAVSSIQNIPRFL